MNGPQEEKRIEELFAAYLAGTLSPEDEGRFNSWLESSPENLRQFIRQLELHNALLETLAEVSSSAPSEGTPRIDASHPTAKNSIPPTRRTFRRQSSDRSSSWKGLAVAAAVLAVATLIVVLRPSERDPAASNRAKEARARASQEAEARKQADSDRLERARVLGDSEARRHEAEAQAKRLEAEARLREIEERRRALTQAQPEAVEGPESKEKREKDLQALKRDQERIEQELREAAQLAKKTAQPARALPPQEEKLPPSPAVPATPVQGTTQAGLARVEEVAGDAFIVVKDAKTPLTSDANLLPGQGLRTGGGASRIVLRFPDKTRVDLGPDTVLVELKVDSGKRLVLTQGTVRAVVTKQPKGEPLIVTTPQGQAKVVGTTLRLAVDPDPKKGTWLEVEEGKVELKNLAGRTVMVESGHYAVAAVGVELVARVLPPRPGLAAFVYRNPRQSWGAVLQTVTLVPGQTYALSVWIQTSTPDPKNVTGLFPGGSIGVRTESGSILAQQPFGPSEAYARTELVFKAGSNSAAIIYAGFAGVPVSAPDGNAWIRLDDWSLIQKGGDGMNLIQDPDYEGQNPTGELLSGPWFTEGPLSDGLGVHSIGVERTHGRIPVSGAPRGERK
ncbi:MAG TPA: FecR domain-containing protein [Planctomycetota bacterium]|nr:FecR domain-containing protein [Planctomycetota bacterium]